MSVPGKHEHLDFSKFDNMSTSALEEILRQDAMSVALEDTDVDMILYITEVLARRENETQNETIDTAAAWNRFQADRQLGVPSAYAVLEDDAIPADPAEKENRNQQTVIPFATENSTVYRRKQKWAMMLSRVAIFAILLLGIGTITSYAAGYNLWGAIIDWTSTTFHISLPAQQQELPYYGVDVIQNTLAEHGISGNYAPQWLPDGYAFSNIEVTDSKAYSAFIAAYTNSSDVITLCVKHHDEFTPETFEKDSRNVVIFECHGQTFYIIDNIQQKQIVWNTDRCVCSISGTFSVKDAKKMIRSIYEENNS